MPQILMQGCEKSFPWTDSKKSTLKIQLAQFAKKMSAAVDGSTTGWRRLAMHALNHRSNDRVNLSCPFTTTEDTVMAHTGLQVMCFHVEGQACA